MNDIGVGVVELNTCVKCRTLVEFELEFEVFQKLKIDLKIQKFPKKKIQKIRNLKL